MHTCGGNNYVLMFPREMQGATSMKTTTTQERKDDDTWTKVEQRIYEMALGRLRHNKQLNNEVIDTYLAQICTQDIGIKSSAIPTLYTEKFMDDDHQRHANNYTTQQ